MENKLKKLRSSMEKSVFDEYSFDSRNKRAVRDKISGGKQTQAVKVKPFLSLAFLFGLAVVIFAIAGYGSGLLPLENRSAGPGKEVIRNVELQLVDVNVELTNAENKIGGIGIQSGPKKGKVIRPITLYYTFTIKNTGSTPLGKVTQTEDFSNPKGVAVKIDPSNELVAVIEEAVGFNVYQTKEYSETRMGHGQQFTPVLKPGQAGEFVLIYELGALEDNPEIPLAPSEEQLNRIEEHARQADLVVTVDKNEIERFDLRNRK
ncbi:hypothetical protein [Bacillus marinisedimentorum]|uniref:hypothetical protein n=1 Tax=Bacillus marinisedimentorum TaxID=1821260 RepID=UPI000872460B|nr:hypothetical protein [Bacillus marinisedimentorum]